MNKLSDFSDQTHKRHLLKLPEYSSKKPRKNTVKTASVFIKSLGLPLISKTTHSPCKSFHLESYRPYTIGRDYFNCDFVFNDSRVSKTHCQVLFDSLCKKIYLSDGLFFSFIDCESSSRVRVSLNGVFVNGVKIGKGEVVELRVGDEVFLVCENERFLNMVIQVGFIVERIVLVEDIIDGNVSGFEANGGFINHVIGRSGCNKFDSKAGFLLSKCREILCSNDPIKYIRKCMISDHAKGTRNYKKIRVQKLLPNRNNVKLNCEDHHRRKEVSTSADLANPGNLAVNSCKDTTVAIVISNEFKFCIGDGKAVEQVENTGAQHENIANPGNLALKSCKETTVAILSSDEFKCCNGDRKAVEQVENTSAQHENDFIPSSKPEALSSACVEGVEVMNKDGVPPPGRKFCLNRLQFVGSSTLEHHNVVSLPELFYPVQTLVRVFIATFTSDISWFLSYCEIPPHLPVTIACHNAERCWNSSPDKRTSSPYSDFPNLAVVYPPFPEVIAFGKDRKKSGIACHHPKLLVLQRQESLRVVVTSANLVARQWQNLTNTVWWQDFPRLSVPDYLSLFMQSSHAENDKESKSDFAAQLAGFLASLVADIPSQDHWVLELAKYNFKGALAHLIASVPGIYSPKSPYISDSKYFLCGNQHMPKSSGAVLLGSVEASVVGLSYHFCSSADSNGEKLKKLATFLGKCYENVHGMSEIILRRETNIPADANAVSVLLPDPEELCMEDYVLLGFLSRNVAKWMAPLSDSGLFAFSGYVKPKEVLRAASEGSNNKVHLTLYVSQGPSFLGFSEVIRAEHVSAVCSLVASFQRCVGLWRLQEVLGHYSWPEYLETDFIFGSSSVGSVNAQFLAAFSAAAGKRSLRLCESEESDPDWGCWSASQELRNPSIRIIFPTIERVKNASSGILASKYILCFSEKTWQRLKRVGILHDAIPYPNERVGFPMHVKVACRRFKSRTDGSSFGWVYCGSHNFSAAAWGRPLSRTLDGTANASVSRSSILGSRLHVCNYELGIVFTVPPPEGNGIVDERHGNLDDIVLPFVIPAPKYGPRDRPATAQATREALAELTDLQRESHEAARVTSEWEAEEVPLVDEEELLEAADFVAEEKEDEKAYAEKLWIEVDSSESC